MIEDIRYLIVFAKVAEAGTLSGAAAALNLTPATVSGHLARLEESLGAALVYRNTRKLSLTADGASLLETARGMLELYENGLIEFRRRPVGGGDSLKIAIPAVLVNCAAFMDALAAFVERTPRLRLDVLCSDHRSDVIGDGIDVAFRIGELADSGLKARPVFSFARTVVASPALLARRAPPVHPRELAGLPWVGLTMLPGVRTFVHADGDSETVRYVPRVRADSVEAAYRLSVRGLGLTAPPAFMAAEDLRQGRWWKYCRHGVSRRWT